MQPSVDLPYLTRNAKGKQYAYTRLPDGSRPSLGRAGSPESWHRLASLRRELEGSDRPLPPAAHDEQLTVAELAERYLRSQIDRFELDDITRTTLLLLRSVVFTLIEHHAAVLVTDFGPRALKSIQAHLKTTRCRTDAGRHRGNPTPPTLSTSEINRRINTIRRVFRWGVSEELVPPTILQALESVQGLRRGEARENPDRTAVPLEDVERVLDAIRSDADQIEICDQIKARDLRTQADALEFLRWTGCRPGEACNLRAGDLRIDHDPPVAVLAEHKTARATGRPRIIPLNREAVRLVSRNKCGLADTDLVKTIFRRGTGEKTKPLTPNSLYQLVRRYCKKSTTPQWSPYQIRHFVASSLVNSQGSDTAIAALLGHTANSTVVHRYSRDRLLLANSAATSLLKLTE